MELADILSEESVLVCTDVTSKRDVLQTLSDKVATLTGHPAAEIFEVAERSRSRWARPAWAMASPCRTASSPR